MLYALSWVSVLLCGVSLCSLGSVYVHVSVPHRHLFICLIVVLSLPTSVCSVRVWVRSCVSVGKPTLG